MTFQRIPRNLHDAKPPAYVEPDSIALKWKDDGDTPVLMINIGQNLARDIGMKSVRHRVQLFIGERADSGHLGIKLVDGPDGDFRVQPARHGYRVFVPCHIALKFFEFSSRVTIHRSAIELRDGMLVFAYAGLKA